MPVDTLDQRTATRVAPSAAPRRFAVAATFASVYIYLLIVFGGAVRITGSGLGCGPDWPKCNGHWIPPFDLHTLIEYTHRLIAASLFLPLGILALAAWSYRREPALAGRGGAIRPAVLAFGLVIVQALLGAATVKLDLPAGVTALHFVTAMLILGALVLAALRARRPDMPATPQSGRIARIATFGAVFGLVTIAFGALTANLGLVGATSQPGPTAWACQGFPFCNGQLWPSGGSFVQTHWLHRLLAYALLAYTLWAARATWRAGAPAPVKRGVVLALIAIAGQIAVAAAMVLLSLPNFARGLHLAVGAALWASLVYWAARSRDAARM